MAMALSFAASATVVKATVSTPPVTVAVKLLSSAALGATWARMSKFVSAAYPLSATLKTRCPFWVQ